MGERLSTGEICTREVTIAFRSTSLQQAAELMRASHVGCLVVVDETEGLCRVAGLLTDRDLVTEVIAAGVDPATLQVGDVMSADPVCAHEDDSLIDLMRSMREHGVRRIPVVGARGELVGVATLDDLLGILAQELGLLVAAIASGQRRERRLRE